MANTYLTRTFGSSPSTTKFTWSAWVKRSKLGTQQAMISGYQSSNTGQLIYFTSDDKFAYYAQASGTVKCNLICDARLRDTNAWYHLVLVVDSSQASASDRVKFYVNNVEQSYTTTVAHTQNWDAYFMLTVPTNVGRNGMNTSDYFDGSMSHMHMTHGYNYTPSTFGSVDSTTGEWKINTSPTVNYNSNGFFILKDGNTGTDHSGNSETFSSGGGTLTNTEDCPSNVFATMNSLSAGSDMAFTFGNTGIRNDVGTWNSGLSTIAPATGKYYWEVYVHGGGDNNTGVSLSSAYGGTHSEVDAGRVVYSRNGYIYREGLSGQSNVSTGITYGDGDYIGVAFDTENGVLTFYKNGTAVTNGATTDTSFLPSNNEYLVQCGLYNGGEFRFNFGNGAFGSTQLTGTTYQGDGNIGIFKYEPPTGFTALSTKGLNE